ncbi:hypothetical protein FZC79_06315 [Rossellomorea vietnamensis]|uniref:Uncharacterized protein n=1 Tax=Rossellomorea vietnamensis TaxID=218284 RepID=A0A5D4KJN9_9BACI|nr:hypothetical protein FZC79_06315 [Rossellomorea vietnamensis]
MPVGADQGASTFYTGAAEEAHRPPRGVVRLERKSILFYKATIFEKTAFLKALFVNFVAIYNLIRKIKS